ncbi:MAG: hypothetical protein NUV53_04855 [Patescibacteria group bacterium]|nr:hypothetical protein [Patescibacteria group bacterium]
MIHWIITGIIFVATMGTFAWWRSNVLDELPPASSPISAPAVTLPPIEADRDALLQFEEDRLRQKAKDAGVEFTTSTPYTVAVPTSSVMQVASSTADATTSFVESVASSTVKSVEESLLTEEVLEVATSTADTASSTVSEEMVASSTAINEVTSTATIAIPNPPITIPPSAATSSSVITLSARQFLIDGAGFCSYEKGISSVVLSGYPLSVDVAVSGDWIKEWTTTRVIFFAPDSIPAGTYNVTVRGVNSWGYCTASTSTPAFIVVP